MKKPNISEHISYYEATKSQIAARYGINNNPPDPLIAIMQETAEKVFEPIRRHFAIPIAVTSFYRSPTLNKMVGGSESSQHMTGQAIDFDADIYRGVTNIDIFNWAQLNVDFDQIILEAGVDGWIHISYNGKANRRKRYRAEFKNGKPIYIEI